MMTVSPFRAAAAVSWIPSSSATRRASLARFASDRAMIQSVLTAWALNFTVFMVGSLAGGGGRTVWAFPVLTFSTLHNTE